MSSPSPQVEFDDLGNITVSEESWSHSSRPPSEEVGHGHSSRNSSRRDSSLPAAFSPPTVRPLVLPPRHPRQDSVTMPVGGGVDDGVDRPPTTKSSKNKWNATSSVLLALLLGIGISFALLASSIAVESWMTVATPPPTATPLQTFSPPVVYTVTGIAGLVDNRTVSTTHNPTQYVVLPDWSVRMGLVSVCWGSECNTRGSDAWRSKGAAASLLDASLRLSFQRRAIVNSTAGEIAYQDDLAVLNAFTNLLNTHLPYLSTNGSTSSIFGYQCSSDSPGYPQILERLLTYTFVGLCCCVVVEVLIGCIVFIALKRSIKRRPTQCLRGVILFGVFMCMAASVAAVVLMLLIGGGGLGCEDSTYICDRLQSSLGVVSSATRDINTYATSYSDLRWLQLLGLTPTGDVTSEGSEARVRLLRGGGDSGSAGVDVYGTAGSCAVGPSLYLCIVGCAVLVICMILSLVVAFCTPPTAKKRPAPIAIRPPPLHDRPSSLTPRHRHTNNSNITPIQSSPAPSTIRTPVSVPRPPPPRSPRRSPTPPVSLHTHRVSPVEVDEEMARADLWPYLLFEHEVFILGLSKVLILQHSEEIRLQTVEGLVLPMLDLNVAETWCRRDIEDRYLHKIQRWVLWCLKRVDMEGDGMMDVPNLLDLLHKWLLLSGGSEEAFNRRGIAVLAPSAAASAAASYSPRPVQPPLTTRRIEFPTSISPIYNHPPRVSSTTPSSSPPQRYQQLVERPLSREASPQRPPPPAPPNRELTIQERYAVLIRDCMDHSYGSPGRGTSAVSRGRSVSSAGLHEGWGPEQVLSRLQTLRHQ